VVLQSHEADPVLATWQTGLGRVAAFTSDSGGLWSEQMVTWKDFNRFWANVVTWSMPPADDSGIRTLATVVGGTAHMTVQLPGEGLAVGGLGGENSWPANITAGVIRPDGSTQVLPLQATAPGQYEGEIPAAMPGPYLVKLSAGTKRQSVQLGDGWSISGECVPYLGLSTMMARLPWYLFVGRWKREPCRRYTGSACKDGSSTLLSTI
jgi:hypothetical protein